MRRVPLLLSALLVSSFASAQGIYQHGTIIRMRTTECISSHHGFVSVMGGPQAQGLDESCPEYTLVGNKVVFVIVGKTSNEIVPLAEVTDYRFNKHELAIRVDDARKESKFTIKEMILRSQWELMQKRLTEELNSNNLSGDKVLALRSSE